MLQCVFETQFLVGQQGPGMCSTCTPSTGEAKAEHAGVHQTVLNSKCWANLSHKVKALLNQLIHQLITTKSSQWEGPKYFQMKALKTDFPKDLLSLQ